MPHDQHNWRKERTILSSKTHLRTLYGFVVPSLLSSFKVVIPFPRLCTSGIGGTCGSQRPALAFNLPGPAKLPKKALPSPSSSPIAPPLFPKHSPTIKPFFFLFAPAKRNVVLVAKPMTRGSRVCLPFLIPDQQVGNRAKIGMLCCWPSEVGGWISRNRQGNDFSSQANRSALRFLIFCHFFPSASFRVSSSLQSTRNHQNFLLSFRHG